MFKRKEQNITTTAPIILTTINEPMSVITEQVVASDAHTLKNRDFAMTKAYQVLNEMDFQYPERFATNARNLLNGDKIKARRIEVPRK